MVGDHGVHFSCAKTMYKESSSFHVYNKEIELKFLASYHAYSRADGAGAEDSVALRRDMRAGLPRWGAEAMKEMTNNSNDVRSWAYMFPKINRSEGIFPPDKHIQAPKLLRKWNQVKFEYPGRTEDTIGILQYRLVSGEGVWQWADLLAKARADVDKLCDSCSTADQQIVRHLQEDCPRPDSIHNLPVFQDLEHDPARIQGPQVQTAKKRNKKKAVSFPCKAGCKTKTGRAKTFRSAVNANRHMKLTHGKDIGEEKLSGMLYPLNDPVPDEQKDVHISEKSASPVEEKKDTEEVMVEDPPVSDDLLADMELEHKDNQSEDNTTAESGVETTEDEEDEEETWYVEKIVGDKNVRGKQMYEVRWIGFEETTWEPEASFVGHDDAIKAYKSEKQKHSRAGSASKAASKPAGKRKAKKAPVEKNSEQRVRRSRRSKTTSKEIECEECKGMYTSVSGATTKCASCR